MLLKKNHKPVMVPQQSKVKKPVTSNMRLLIVLGGFTAAFAILIGRAVYIHTVSHEFLMKEGAKRFVRTVKLPASRGMIMDRNGAVLALSAPTEALYAVPSDMEVQPSIDKLQTLSRLINVPVDTLQAKLGQHNKNFVYLQRQLSEETADQVRALDIKGLAFEQESKRHYPMGNLFSHVLGFVNIDSVGIDGLERKLNSQLQGKNGAKVVMRDKDGNIIDQVNSPNNRMPQNGRNITLSLDQRIQTLAAEELEKAMVYHQAKAGSVVVLDGRTGELLAMVNSPSYDSNEPTKSEMANRRNRAVTDMIEPGSAMKPFPIAKGLDDGKVNVNQSFNTNPYQIGTNVVKDTHNYGSLTVRGIMQKSSNVGTVRISARYMPEEIHQFYRSVGFGRNPQAGLQGEISGLLRPWQKWKPIDQATMSYGYGIQMSLLQLARAYTIFSTDGQLMPVSIEKLDKAPEGEQVIQPATAKTMRKIMMSVTEPGGTGLAGAVDGFDVAAKTGTAQKLVDGSYVNTKHTATFVGFAPAENPRVIVAVNIDEPTVNGYYGGIVAGPVFKGVMAGSLNILGAPNTKPLKEKAVVQTAQNQP